MKTYHGRSMSDALAKVKRDLGRDAVILRTRTLQRGGVWGLGAKMVVEITATADAGVSTLHAARDERRKSAVAESTIGHRPPPKGSGLTAVGLRPAAKPTESVNDQGADPAVLREIRELRGLVSGLVKKRSRQTPTMPAELIELYTKLLRQQVAEELARGICGQVAAQLAAAGDARVGDGPAWTRQAIEAELRRCIESMVPAAAPLQLSRGDRPTVVALVGPTGVGKTTTVAKLAANTKLRERKTVGLITIDNRRIAAMDQLRAYAEIMKLPFAAATSTDEAEEALKRMNYVDLILLDTPGRGQRDEAGMEELRRYLDAVRPDQVHLVLSSTTREETIRETVDKYAPLGAKHLIFTKLDEAVGFGVILNVVKAVELRLSYVTHGQSVPADIEPVGGRRLAELILGEPHPS